MRLAGQPKGVVLTHRALVSVVASQLTFLRDPWGRAGLAATLQRLEAAARGQRRPSGGDQVPDGDGERGGRGAAPAGDAVGNGATALWDVDALPEVQAEARRWPFAFERGVDAHLSYLPLAHIYERALVEAAFAQGAAVGCWQASALELPQRAPPYSDAPLIVFVVVRCGWRLCRATWTSCRTTCARSSPPSSWACRVSGSACSRA